jgi:transglutaminase-like putative cysteine protease
MEAMAIYCRPGRYVDSDHPEIRRFAAEAGTGRDDREKAVALYYAVRDGIRYDPYRIDISEGGLKASRTLALGHGFCINKAALYAAALRALGIPARLGFADVRNHLTSPKLAAVMQTDLFIFHGYTEVWLEGRWVKATPAFNLSLCQKAGVLPLEFDGRTDSIFHPFDRSGRRHLEYLRHRGTYEDVPRDEIVSAFLATYPMARAWLRGSAAIAGDFEAEAVAASEEE